jgi:hypothetical protein
MSEMDVPPWQQPETVPATTEWLDESPFAAGAGTAPLTELPLGAELGAASETTAVAGEDEVPGSGQLPADPESGLEAADIASPGETGSTDELHHPEHLFETQGLAEAEELFEAEEFARHAIYQTITDEALDTEVLAAMELPARPAPARPRILTTSQLRNAWHGYECAEHHMVPLQLFGRWNTPVNPVTVDAWRALERALTATGYQAHRAWVYNCRDINGQHTRSLHAYGLAIDIDDTRPTCNVNRATPDRREVRFSAAPTKEERCADVGAGIADTSFSPAQVAAVEAIRTVDGQQVFAWGGRWHTTKDTMHFQINVTPGELDRGLQPGTVEQHLAELPGELETVPYEALGGFEPEFDTPGRGEPAGENQAADISKQYGNIVVSTGGYGTALRRFAKDWTVHDDVLSLLKQSPTYMSIVATLDAKYLDGKATTSFTLPLSDDGVFTKGPNIGRRLIFFELSSNGSFFMPHGAPDNNLNGDIIWLRKPRGTGDPTARENVTLATKGSLVQSIAHESVHAARRVLDKRRPGKTAAERIRASVDDEIETRKTERKIVDEIRKNSPTFAKYQPATGSFERWAVERDFFPGEQKRTYLEHFVLSDLHSSARTELTSEQAGQYEKIVKKISIGSPPYTSFLTLTPQFAHPRKGRMPIFRLRYPNILLALRVIDARWRSVKDIEQRDVLQDTTLENMRQEHAKAFFNNLATYTKRP